MVKLISKYAVLEWCNSNHPLDIFGHEMIEKVFKLLPNGILMYNYHEGQLR